MSTQPRTNHAHLHTQSQLPAPQPVLAWKAPSHDDEIRRQLGWGLVAPGAAGMRR